MNEVLLQIKALTNGDPLLTAVIVGVLTFALIGLTGYILKDIFTKVFSWLGSLLFIRLTIDDSHNARTEVFNKLSFLISNTTIPLFSRSISEAVYFDYSVNYDGRISVKSIGYGMHLFKYQGCYMLATRSKVASTMAYDTITVIAPWWAKDKLHSLLEDTRGDISTAPKVSIFEETEWCRYGTLKSEGFSELVLDAGFKQEFMGEVDNFASSGKGVASKLTILLHGKTGTGKTGIARALAVEYCRDLYILNLSTVNDATIHKAIRKVPPGSMLLIEDCDCVKATVSRAAESNVDNPPLTLGGVLNALDGVIPLDDCLVVMTTNHVENLDPALIRKGRVDVSIEVPLISAKQVNEDYFERYGAVLNRTEPMLGCEVYELHRRANLRYSVCCKPL
ncbi:MULTISPECIES: AAA family ATPase [Shewanella]|uniref:AAA family ATPase n=1 Tax=Shewanella marisflavi TaxID=260364 RepID=A0ABX5WHX1_9GAMM|nr:MULTISPECIES: AAA family ATPase [Shewanella]QDF74067.1 AAA family ATPase [Shewanella marisflavi]